MKIIIEIDSLLKEEEKIFGIVYFNNDDFFFPSIDWNDFVVIILNWWSSALIELVENRVEETELFFMEGPYSIKIENMRKDYFILRFTTEDSNIVKTDQVLKTEFIKSFLGQTNSVIRRLNELKWSTREIEELKLNFDILLKLV